MPVIKEKIVISKYRAYHTILNKKINYGSYDIRIKDVVQHKETIKSIKCAAVNDYVDIKVKLEIYFVYCVEEGGMDSLYSSQLEEDILLRIYKKSFKPLPYESDFYRCELSAYFRNIRTSFDVDISCRSINIDINTFVVVNLLRERCIEVGNKKEAALNENYINQIALSSDEEIKDAKDYFSNLENYSKIISKKIDDLEKENNCCKEEIKRIESELTNRTAEYLNAVKKAESLSKECERLTQRLSDMEEKYIKEQKKANLLEIENNRNLDEIKQLKKEKNIMLQKADKNKSTLKDKIKLIITGEDKH